MSPGTDGSTVLIDEFFESGDDRFLAEVLAVRSDQKLAALAARWYWDPRPFARRALLAYVDDGCDRPRHKVLVKRLYKLAEAAADDELLGRFMVAFDRLVVRKLVERRSWDWRTRVSSSEWVLQRDRSVPGSVPKPKGRRRVVQPERFSTATRLYLCRRVWRYFRELGRRDPARYRRAVTAALVRYEDRHLERSEQLLDAWSLCHALYQHSSVLERRPRGLRLVAGAKLADLVPAPAYPAIWAEGFEQLLELAEKAASRPVRVFALTLLERDHREALGTLPFVRVRALLDSPHPELQRLAADLLGRLGGLENLPLSEWLLLLQARTEAMPEICRLVARHVHPDRLSLEQTVDLACTSVAPVAELGLSWLTKKPVASAEQALVVLGLRAAPLESVRSAAMTWLGEVLLQAPWTTAEMARDLVDARFLEPRAAGLALVEQRFGDDTGLWTALAESPYDDVRLRFVRHLERWQEAVAPSTVRQLWATALLGIHRGGRVKQQVVTQVARRVAAKPEEADALIPLLGIALRSVRAPERRAGLAAVARAAYTTPALREALARQLPELHLEGLGTP